MAAEATTEQHGDEPTVDEYKQGDNDKNITPVRHRGHGKHYPICHHGRVGAMAFDRWTRDADRTVETP